MSDATIWGEGCPDCGGTGAQYAHTPSCQSDHCVGNGDFYDCGGSWVPCDGCPNVQAANIERWRQSRVGDASADASGLDCIECGSGLNLEHHSSDKGLCRNCYDAIRAAPVEEYPF